MTSAHGGKREGSGRPPTAQPRVKLTVRVSDATHRRLEAGRKLKGMNLGRYLDWLCDHVHGPEPQARQAKDW